MATTGSNFVRVGGATAVLNGTATTAPPFLQALNADSAYAACNGALTNAAIDRIFVDLARTSSTLVSGQTILPFGTVIGGYALNGGMEFTLTGTTAVTVDLTNLAAAVGVTNYAAGDATVTTHNVLILRNTSTSASTITVAPGGSNPMTFPLALAGTTPTIAMLKDDILIMSAAIGKTVDGTHKNILLTPTAGGRFFIGIAGA